MPPTVRPPPPSVRPPGPGNIKGLAFREFLQWHNANYGQAKIVHAISKLPASQRSTFDLNAPAFGILASRWYPAALVHSLLDAAGGARTDGVLENMARDASVAIMNNMMNGIYSFAFSQLASPSRWIALRQQVWDLYFDTGTITSEYMDDRSICTWYTGWRGHHPLACMLTRAANLAIFRAMGLTDVQIQLTRCIAREDNRCEVVIRWA